jgi:hypothetical protein
VIGGMCDSAPNAPCDTRLPDRAAREGPPLTLTARDILPKSGEQASDNLKNGTFAVRGSTHPEREDVFLRWGGGWEIRNPKSEIRNRKRVGVQS